MYGLSEYTLNTLKTLFQKHPGIQSVILYGSRAKGNYRNGSDIDITLHTDDSFGFNELSALAGDFDDSDMPYFVDVSIYNQLRDPDLIAHIKRVGKILYTKGVNHG
jgi:predicted nucleotidyltransferase